MYHTGICDESLSTRTVIHALSELKRLIHEKVYIVTGTGITEHSFSEVKTQNGCINLYGIEISGTALSELYITYQNDRFYSHNTKTFLTIVLSLVDAALLLKEKKGLYPTLYLNGVFFDSERMNVTFLPQKLSEFVSRYRTDSEQRLLSFCVRKSGMGTAEDEEDISNAFGLIAGAIEERSSNQKGALPFLRRASLLRFRYAFLRFLSIRKKILVIALILLGIGAYLVFDYLKSVDKKDYTAGLDAHQVVELYFKGVDELDLAVIDAVFSRGAGREIKNEISTLYVTTRMHQAFGEKSLNQNEGEIEARPEQPVDAHLGKTQSYGIKDLIIEREKNDESPVFTARYKKFLSSGNKDTVYSIQETIYLKKIDERWYIIKTERTLLNNQHSLE
jgi:hypothetical protein